MNPAALKPTPCKTPVTRPLAEFAAGLKYAEIPQPVLQAAKHCLLDWFGVTLAGAGTDTAQLIREATLSAGEVAQATLIGGPGRTSCANAALINGTTGHALDFDDMHYAMLGHTTAAIAPALIAHAEREALSGEELLRALVAGVDVACRIGLFLTRDHYLKGWHATGTLGAFGAAAAVARAMDLDADSTALALGIAATQTSGLKSMFGTMCKPLHAGKAAGNGLFAAHLAARGFSSRADVLDCEQGYAELTTSSTNPGAALEDLGNHFHIRNVLFKFHAACYGTHAGIEAAGALLRGRAIDPRHIEAIELNVPVRSLRVCNISHPQTGLEAKFSLRLTCAMALCGESTADIHNFTAHLCRKPMLVELRDKITVQGNVRLADGTCELKVHLADAGSRVFKGDVSSPAEDLDEQERRLMKKYQTLATPVLGIHLSEDLAGMILDLDHLQDIRSLMALTRA